MTLANVAVAMLIAFVVEVLVEHFVGAPLEKKAPQVDRWFLIYVVLVAAGAVTWFAGVNLFEGVLAGALLGRILTCLVIGGGSQLLH